MRATLSLLGLYNYDNTVLDGFTLPSNFSSEELAAIKNNLLVETAEFEILYSDPVFLKFAITQWCNKRRSTWKWLRDSQLYEYNPLWNENYNDDITRDLRGTLDATDVRTDNLQTAKTGSDTKKLSGDDTLKRSGTDSELNSVYAMDDQNNGSPDHGSQITYNSQNKTEYDSQTKTTYDSTVKDTGTQQQKLDHDTTDTGTIKRKVQGLHGAFPQEAIEKEQNIAMLNMLDFIIADFKKRFCLLVY